MLELKGIRKDFNIGTPDRTTLFDNFDFTVKDGEFVSVIGSNGSGKTTLLNLICGSLLPDEGKITFDGKDITRLAEYKRAAFIGRVFQNRRWAHAPILRLPRIWRLRIIKARASGFPWRSTKRG